MAPVPVLLPSIRPHNHRNYLSGRMSPPLVEVTDADLSESPPFQAPPSGQNIEPQISNESSSDGDVAHVKSQSSNPSTEEADLVTPIRPAVGRWQSAAKKVSCEEQLVNVKI